MTEIGVRLLHWYEWSLKPEQEIGWYNLYTPHVYCKYTGMYRMTRSKFVQYQFGLQACTMHSAYNHRWKETLQYTFHQNWWKKKNNCPVHALETLNDVKIKVTCRKRTYVTWSPTPIQNDLPCGLQMTSAWYDETLATLERPKRLVRANMIIAVHKFIYGTEQC